MFFTFYLFATFFTFVCILRVISLFKMAPSTAARCPWSGTRRLQRALGRKQACRRTLVQAWVTMLLVCIVQCSWINNICWSIFKQKHTKNTLKTNVCIDRLMKMLWPVIDRAQVCISFKNNVTVLANWMLFGDFIEHNYHE